MRVLHFVRKNTQLKASFIQNQIINHIDFNPVVVFRKKVTTNQHDGGFSNDVADEIKIIDLGSDETFFEKILFRFFKRLSSRQQLKLQEYISQIKPDILHFHYGTDAGIYLPALRKIALPKVVSFYGYDCSVFPRRLFGYGREYLKSRVFKYSDLVLAMSPDMEKDLITAGCPSEKIRVHYYGSEVQKYYQEHDYSQNPVCRFLIISGLVPKKGHIFLLKAFSAALQTNQNISLTIVGSGPVEQEIVNYVIEYKLKEKVTFPGPVVYGSNEHHDYFKTHDVFIHSSIRDVNGDKEGIPGAIVEAMAAGLPVASTFHAGIPYIIENEKTGLLVREWDIPALADAIIRLSGSSESRKKLGVAGQEYALNHLDLKNKEKELEEIYNSLIDQH